MSNEAKQGAGGVGCVITVLLMILSLVVGYRFEALEQRVHALEQRCTK